MTVARGLRRLRVVAVAAIVAACGLSALADQVPAEAVVPLPTVFGGEYLLQPGDVIDVKFYYSQDLNETVPVRPDGRISLQLVNEVPAAGRTPAALREDLLKRYAPLLRQPEVAVIIKQVAPRRLYIGGEVRTPSLLRVEGPVTLLQAIFEAGGLTRSGKATDVVVLRYNGQPQPEFIKVNVEAALKGGDLGGNIPLQALDIVWVPRTKVAHLGDFVDQYVRQILPLPVTLGITYLFGGLTQ